MLTEFFDLLQQRNVSPNGLLLLQIRHTNVVKPTLFQVILEERRLELAGYLSKGVITSKAIGVLEEVEALLGTGKQRRKVSKIPLSDWAENIQRYSELFPSGMQGSAPIRSPAKVLHERFQWFFGEYPEYDWELVLTATEKYLESLRASGDHYKYISTNKYFIKKQENGGKTTLSRLA